MAEYEFESELKSQNIHVFKVTGKASSIQIIWLSKAVKFISLFALRSQNWCKKKTTIVKEWFSQVTC